MGKGKKDKRKDIKRYSLNTVEGKRLPAIILGMYTFTGMEETVKYLKENQVRFLDLTNEGKFKSRVRTEEELKELADAWDSEKHLLSGHAYAAQKKDEIIFERNPNFINDCMTKIEENLYKFTFIFVRDDHDLRHAIIEKDWWYTWVYTDYVLKYEIVGRCFENKATRVLTESLLNRYTEIVRTYDREWKTIKYKHRVDRIVLGRGDVHDCITMKDVFYKDKIDKHINKYLINKYK